MKVEPADLQLRVAAIVIEEEEESQECCDGAKLQQTPGENETGGKEDRVSLIDQLREEQVTWCCWSWEQP